MSEWGVRIGGERGRDEGEKKAQDSSYIKWWRTEDPDLAGASRSTQLAQLRVSGWKYDAAEMTAQESKDS